MVSVTGRTACGVGSNPGRTGRVGGGVLRPAQGGTGSAP